MSITKTQTASPSTLEEKITAPFREAKAKLEEIEADAKRKNIELAALAGLALTKRTLDRKLEDYKKAHETHRSRAKTEIAAEIAAFTAGVHELVKKHKAASAKK